MVELQVSNASVINKWAPYSDKPWTPPVRNEKQAQLEALHSKPWLLRTSHIDIVSYLKDISVIGCEMLFGVVFFNLSKRLKKPLRVITSVLLIL